jgi:hypothetical protein
MYCLINNVVIHHSRMIEYTAKWTCCEAVVRTHDARRDDNDDDEATKNLLGKRDVCMIIARRELFPPTLDVRQDIVITVIGDWGHLAVELVSAINGHT